MVTSFWFYLFSTRVLKSFSLTLKSTNQLLTFETKTLLWSLFSSHTLNHQSFYQGSNYSVNRLPVMPSNFHSLPDCSSNPTIQACALFPRLSPQLKRAVFENSGLEVFFLGRRPMITQSRNHEFFSQHFAHAMKHVQM